MPAKLRFHRALTRELKRVLRSQGLSVDEEAAQFALGGLPLSLGYSAELLETAQLSALDPKRRQELMAAWIREFPDNDGYPPPFAKEILRVVHRAQRALDEDPDTLMSALEEIVFRCQIELLYEPPLKSRKS